MTRHEQPRIGVVGVGPISDWHVRALQVAGCAVTAVATRPGSSRLHEFAARHAVPNVYDDWQTMLSRRDEWDALVIATHPDGTPPVLTAALELRVPILVEKPVAWASQTLQTLLEQSHSQVIVGFNRRFYHTVERARAEAQGGPPLLATLMLPDAVTAPDGDVADRHYLRPLFDMGCHGLDLLRFVLGEVEIVSARQVCNTREQPTGFTALLTSARGDAVQVIGNWSTPANYALTLHRPGRRVELLPLEVATVYDGMDVSEPTDDFPVRRYLPRATEQIFLSEIDRREKPGFVAQAQVLRSMVYGQRPDPRAATLADALAAARLCEALSGGLDPV